MVGACCVSWKKTVWAASVKMAGMSTGVAVGGGVAVAAAPQALSPTITKIKTIAK
jgi:hypothetical protein